MIGGMAQGASVAVMRERLFMIVAVALIAQGD
jgi:hypothetical protein